LSVVKTILCKPLFVTYISLFEVKYAILVLIPADSDGDITVKARSVGASPRQLNIDPMALLTAAKPSKNVEAAVSFDEPAQFSATLHNAGKVWWLLTDSCVGRWHSHAESNASCLSL
jgi:hypothetical protein